MGRVFEAIQRRKGITEEAPAPEVNWQREGAELDEVVDLPRLSLPPRTWAPPRRSQTGVEGTLEQPEPAPPEKRRPRKVGKTVRSFHDLIREIAQDEQELGD